MTRRSFHFCWDAELIEAACDLARRYGSKAAAGMFGMHYDSFRRQMNRVGVSLLSVRRG